LLWQDQQQNVLWQHQQHDVLWQHPNVVFGLLFKALCKNIQL